MFLKVLGTIGKGWATISGGLVAVAGIVLAGKADAQHAVETIVTNVPAVVTAVGTLLAVFGVGRKAGRATAP